jgi:hypothetical protein
MLRIAALLAVLGGTLAASAAHAQLGSLFGDSPPRPPANIPNGVSPASPSPPPPPPPVQSSGTNPVPVTPQASPPAVSSIQSEPLPPPPGTSAAPPPQSRQGAAPQSPAALEPTRLTPSPTNAPAQPSVGSQAPAASSPTPEPAIAPPPQETIVTPSPKIDNARAVFSGLDKITGRITSFDVAVGETVQFGALRVTPRACYTRPPTEATNTDAFVAVDEVTLQGEIKRIFTGWMFASSPGLHAIEHPIYDVWLTDCSAPLTPTGEAAATTPTPTVAATGTPAPATSQTSRRTSHSRHHRQSPATAPVLRPAHVQPN